MSLIVIPNIFSAGAVVIASQHNSNFSTIYSDYNGNIDNTNISGSAAIAYSKLNLTGNIVDADISASAAIVDTKLAQITTASKVHGSSITGLASLPSGAGVIPNANLPSFAGIQIFTSSGTFTAPAGKTKVYITMVGGGGGGGGGGWGASGGNTGYYAGGTGGAAVVGNSYITWINTGTRYGDIT